MASQNFNPFLDGQSKTEQLIYRTSYRNHKKKLEEIKAKPINTSLNLYGSVNRKPDDQKKIVIMRNKRQQIELQNQKLKKKIQRIKDGNPTAHTSVNRASGFGDSDPHRKTSLPYNNTRKRYSDEVDHNDKIEVNSDCQGENIKCFVPGPRNRASKFTSDSYHKSKYASMFENKKSSKNLEHENQEPDNQQENDQNVDDGLKQFQEALNGDSRESMTRKLSNYIRKSSAPSHDALFNHPEKESHRLVVFKKTKIPFPFCSYLIQISIINKRILITAYGMGAIAQNYKIILDKKKTKKLYEESNRSYEQIWERVQITADGMKISGTDHQSDNIQTHDNLASQAQNKEEKEQKIKQKKVQAQQRFLQRNYYALLKEIKSAKQDQNNIHSIKQTLRDNTSHKSQKVASNARGSYIRKKLENSIEKNPTIQSNKNIKQQQINSSIKIQISKNTKQKIPKNQEDSKQVDQKIPKQSSVFDFEEQIEDDFINNRSVSGISEIKKVNSVSERTNNMAANYIGAATNGEKEGQDNDYQQNFEQSIPNNSNMVNGFTKKKNEQQPEEEYISEYESVPNNSNMMKNMSKPSNKEYQEQFEEQIGENYSQQFNNNSSVQAVKKANITQQQNKSQIVEEEYLDEQFET